MTAHKSEPIQFPLLSLYIVSKQVMRIKKIINTEIMYLMYMG